MSAEPRTPVVIGLVGAIGAGKSRVARVLVSLGCELYDADAESHRVFELDDVQDQMRAWWGDRVVDEQGRVSRSLVGHVVFAEPEARRRLEAMIHPRLAEAREQAKQRAQDRGAPGVVIDAPLLFEAGLEGECDVVVCVTARDETRLARVAERGWDEAELRRRDAVQLPLKEKARLSGVVLPNDGTLEELESRVRELFTGLVGTA